MARKFFIAALAAVFVVSCFSLSALAQEAKVAVVNVDKSGIRWEIKVSYSSATLTVSAPGGAVTRKEFTTGIMPVFTTAGLGTEALPDGQYSYELRFLPATRGDAALRTRQLGDSDAAGNLSRRVTATDDKEIVQSGSFVIKEGRVFVVAPSEKNENRPVKTDGQSNSKTPVAGQTDDVVTPDNVIIQGSSCIGIDCVDNETFGFDTLRFKENNTRITFIDTSATSGFAVRDWRLRANESPGGGRNAFFIDDLGDSFTNGSETVSSTPFTLLAGAPTNSFFLDSIGRLGLRTSTPSLDIHMLTSDTPAIRFEQSNAGSFTAQTWDIGANEANFFIRDLTGGSRLPFRIRPGAPTSSLDIGGDGVVSFLKGIKLPVLDGNGVPTSALVDQTALLSPLGPNFATHVTGAIGIIDESSTAFADLDNITGAGIKAGTNPAQITVRYNVTPNPNFFAAGSTQMVFKTRYRDSDGAGSGARVIVTMHQTDITTGVDTTTTLLNSNQNASTGTGFVTHTLCVPTNGIPLSFANQSVWIEVRIGVTVIGEQANFSQLEIYRGLSCP